MNGEGEVEAVTKFEACKQTVVDVAFRHGEYTEGAYDEGRSYRLDVDGLTVEVYDWFAHNGPGSGAFSGISINYTTPDGANGKDHLMFVHRGNEVFVDPYSERRPATEADIKYFESFAQYVKNVAEFQAAEKLRIEQEQRDRRLLVSGLYNTAKAAMKFSAVKMDFDRRIKELAADGGKIAKQIDAMDDDELWATLRSAWWDDQNIEPLNQMQPAIIDEVRTAVKLALEPTTDRSQSS